MRVIERLKYYLKISLDFYRQNIWSLWKMWAIFVGLDLINFYMQTRMDFDPESSRKIEIIYQIIIVYLSVVFIHLINNLKIKETENEKTSLFRIFGEALLLSFGFVLQSIFYLMSIVVGGVLLVLPGLYCALFFNIAPIVSVVYPDYEGKTFMLAHELVKDDRLEASVIILFCLLVPFIPEGLNLLFTGSIRSDWSILVSPFDNIFYLATQLVLVNFTIDKVEAFRVSSNKKGLQVEGL